MFYLDVLLDNILPLVNQTSFKFLDELVKDKKYIFLGESTHTAKEYSEYKLEIIKYLHQNHHFKVLAFESEFGDCFIGDHISVDINSLEFMKGSIGRIWQNITNLELFSYIKDTKQTNNPLSFSGIDVQPSHGKHFRTYLEKELSNELKGKFVEFDENLVALLSKSKIKKKDAVLVKRLIKIGEELIYSLQTEKNELSDGLVHALNMRIDYLKANSKLSFSKLFEYRDHLMAKNLEYIIHTLYSNENIIIWAHNLHIKKNSSNSLLSPYKSIYENLPDHIQNQSLVIGFYAKEGSFATPFAPAIELKKLNKKHLEWHIDQVTDQTSYVNCHSDWAEQKFKVLESGFMRMSIRPKEQFDGLLFFKKISPVEFIERQQE